MPVDKQGDMLPKRQCVANICQWVYRSSECSYTGTNYFDLTIKLLQVQPKMFAVKD